MNYKTKYSKIVKILAIIDAIISFAIMGIAFVTYLHVSQDNIAILLLPIAVVIVIPILIAAVFEIIAATKVDRFGWSLYIAILAGIKSISFLFNRLNNLGYISSALGIVLLIFTIMHLSELKKQENPNSNHSVEHKLNNLSSLYDRGLISKEEYDTRRDEIIRNL